MSRPPTPHAPQSTGGEQQTGVDRLNYLPLEYADLLALQEQLAVTELGRPLTQVDGDGQEADFARTFMELSALVAHVLSVYQRYYAGEAYLSTAQAASSLVRHARRLAYDPDPGLAASGHVVLFAKDLVSGTVAARQPLASVPLGESKAQDYETLDDLLVDAALNELRPVGATRPATVAAIDTDLRVQGVGLGIETGDRVVLTGPHWDSFVVQTVEERPAEGATIVTLDRAVGVTLEPASTPTLLAHPTLTLHPFAFDADSALYPPDRVMTAPGTKPVGTGIDKYWYGVQRAGGGGFNTVDVYLSQQAPEPLTGQYVLRSTGAATAVVQVTAEVVASVTLNREVTQTFQVPTVALTRSGDNFTTTLQQTTISQLVTGHISGTVAAIQVVDHLGGTALARSAQPFPADWLTGWVVEAALAAVEPNHDLVGDSLQLPGLLTALVPGRPLVFTSLDGTRAQVVTIRSAELDEVAVATTIRWDAVTSSPDGGWHLDDLKILGNVARASHGRTVNETVGGSDGVTAFQRFALRESPVTVLLGVQGGEPELEVRVDGVLWDRVQDFADSGPDDRHYRSVTDEALVTSIVFGDGRNGAVPSSGTKNVEAVYRVGLGVAGDVEAGRLTRLKRAHALLDRVVNVTPVSGGAEPASTAAIRAQSTRWIRTFDRAVSVADLADLALTVPGIARAASRPDDALGAVLVVATADGETPAAMDAVQAFLDARRDVSVPLVVTGPTARGVRLGVTCEPDPAYLLEVVKDDLRDALHGADPAAPGMFTFPARELGQPAFLSEVYARLEAVPGVIGVRVDRFNTNGGDSVASVIIADVDEWLSLDPNHLVLNTLTAGRTG